MSKDLQDAMAEAGFTMSDAPPQPAQTDAPEQPMAEAPEAPAPEPVQTQEVAQQSAPEPATPVAEPEAQPVQEAVENNSEPSQDIDVDAEVLRYLSEKLGTEVTAFDALALADSNPSVEIDERVQAINDFVLKTGRSPEDWYKYQQLDPSEMDDLTAVRNQMIVEHGNLTTEEVNMLLSNKYRTDETQYNDDEIAMAKLQLKMDAESARKTIANLRDGYMLPQRDMGEVQSPITEDWITTMKSEVKDFDGLVFELPTGNDFTYGIDDSYRKDLVEKNSNIDNFFDDYVNDTGEWNYEKLNAHRAVIDNIDSIVKSVYQQGLSDGQRKVVENAANISNEPTQRDPSQQSNGLDEQILKAFGGPRTLTFKT